MYIKQPLLFTCICSTIENEYSPKSLRSCSKRSQHVFYALPSSFLTLIKCMYYVNMYSLHIYAVHVLKTVITSLDFEP